jgi:hypothetical protein
MLKRFAPGTIRLCFCRAFEMVAKAIVAGARRFHEQNLHHLTVHNAQSRYRRTQPGKYGRYLDPRQKSLLEPHQRDDPDRPVDEFSIDGRRENTEKGATKAFKRIEAIDAVHKWKKQEKGQGNPAAFLLKASPSQG